MSEQINAQMAADAEIAAKLVRERHLLPNHEHVIKVEQQARGCSMVFQTLDEFAFYEKPSNVDEEHLTAPNVPALDLPDQSADEDLQQDRSVESEKAVEESAPPESVDSSQVSLSVTPTTTEVKAVTSSAGNQRSGGKGKNKNK